MIQISKKGRDYYGNILTEYNLYGNALVAYKKKIYITGNRRNNIVELCDAKGKFICAVDMENIKLITCK